MAESRNSNTGCLGVSYYLHKYFAEIVIDGKRIRRGYERFIDAKKEREDYEKLRDDIKGKKDIGKELDERGYVWKKH